MVDRVTTRFTPEWAVCVCHQKEKLPKMVLWAGPRRNPRTAFAYQTASGDAQGAPS